MIKSIQIEEYKEEIEILLKAYWEEADERRESISMNIDLESYIKLQESGMLEVVAAFNEKEEIVGLLGALSVYDYQTSLTKLIVEVVYVSPEYRENSIAELLIKELESIALEEGIKNIFFTLKTEFPHNSLVKSLDYSHVENVYMKVID